MQAIAKCPSICGIATRSSGNHGAAVAYIARKLNLNSAIVVSEDISKAKIANITTNGGEIIKIQSKQIYML